MDNEFTVNYEFLKPELFLSKQYFQDFTMTGEKIKYRYTIHPYFIIIPSSEQFLDHIKETAKNTLINQYSENLSGLEQLLFSTSQTDFPSLINDGAFDENILEIYNNKIIKTNFLSENQIYFSVKSGCISYNERNKKSQYFEKWIARVWAPKFKIPQNSIIENFLNVKPVFNCEFYVFSKFTEHVENKEIIKTFANVNSFTNTVKIFNNMTKMFLDDISKNITALIFKQNYINNVAENMFERYVQDELTFSREKPKQIIH